MLQHEEKQEESDDRHCRHEDNHAGPADLSLPTR
jgi:hypothetical protein